MIGRGLEALGVIAAVVSSAACVPALPGGTLGEADGSAPRCGLDNQATLRTGGSSPACAPATRLGDSGWAPNIAVNRAEAPPYVYWYDQMSSPPTLEKARVGSGAPLTIGRGQGSSVAVDATHVYWFANRPDDCAIFRADLDGTNAIMLVGGLPFMNATNAIAVGVDGIYFTTSAGTVMKAGLDGGAVTLAAGQGTVGGIVVDAANVYFTRDPGGEIVKLGIGGGTDPVVLVPSGTAPYPLAIDANFVYWIKGPEGAVMRVRTDGGCPPETVFGPDTIETCLGTRNGPAMFVAADATGVYWMDFVGNIFTGLPGQPARALAATGSRPLSGDLVGIALDSTTVYWLTFDGVFAVAK